MTQKNATAYAYASGRTTNSAKANIKEELPWDVHCKSDGEIIASQQTPERQMESQILLYLT